VLHGRAVARPCTPRATPDDDESDDEETEIDEGETDESSS
jgi:hypothetical protein